MEIDQKSQEYKMCSKIEATFEDIMKLFNEDYTLQEKLAIELEYFDFYWTSPMKQFKNRGFTIEKAKQKNILEGIIVKMIEIATKKGDLFIKLFITDGLEETTVNIWGDQLPKLDLNLLQKGKGIIMSAKWDIKYQSFNVIDASQMEALEIIC